MDKTYRTEFHRSFLIETLPDPLTRSSSHIQLFDNYIANTRMRIRSIRVPEAKEWTWVLQQRFPIIRSDLSVWKTSEIYLNETEHAQLEHLEGTEIRKNRYFHEFDGLMFAFDVYLGALWGLNRARVEFASREYLAKFEPPPFAIFEVTNEPFFSDENLVAKTFEEVRAEVTKIGNKAVIEPEFPDE
ncbi:MAG: hypothetical protein ACT4O9_16090 [Blastocatellia bacterium]